LNGTSQGGECIDDLPYIERLGLGWSKQAPAGMLGVTLAEFQRYVVEAAAEVKK
jgi:Fe-S cluster assembly ATPase SufC